MPRTKGSHSRKFDKFPQPHFEAPIIKGVASQLRRWPSDLFLAYLAACFIIGSLVFLIFVTVAFCLPAATDNRCRYKRDAPEKYSASLSYFYSCPDSLLQFTSFGGYKFGFPCQTSVNEIGRGLSRCFRVIESFPIAGAPNVYFLKLGNRTWSTREFCYIETAARRHPDFNVYLINLLKHEPKESLKDERHNETETISNLIQSIPNTNSSVNLTPEEQLKKRLVSGNPNIQSIDTSIERFFEGSKLLEIVKVLNDGMLELAAKAQLLWNSPGIVLNPDMYCNLESMEQFLCNRNKEKCLPDKRATIELKNDIQAAGVPCQAFVGFLMREISKNTLDQGYTLEEALKQYCPRSHYCPEVRFVDLKSECTSSELNCPIIYSSKIL